MELSAINTKYRYFGLQLGANPPALRANCNYLVSSSVLLKFMVIKLKGTQCVWGVFQESHFCSLAQLHRCGWGVGRDKPRLLLCQEFVLKWERQRR